MKTYLARMKRKSDCPPRKPITKILWSWLGALLGIYAIGLGIPYLATFSGLDGTYLIGSFGASAVLLYGSPMADFAQPRNLLLGNLVSALVGITVATHVPSTELAFAGALAVSSSVLLMHLTRSMHPPGGATAFIATVGGSDIQNLGYWYVVFPVLGGSLVLLAIALVVNNLSGNPQRHYPVYWF